MANAARKWLTPKNLASEPYISNGGLVKGWQYLSAHTVALDPSNDHFRGYGNVQCHLHRLMLATDNTHWNIA